MLFASQTDPQKNLGQLVNKPLSKYSHLTGSDGYLTEHSNKDYHKASQVFSDSFLHSLSSKTNVAMMVDDQHRKLVQENRDRLVPIVKTTILCAKLGIAYRKNPKKGKDPSGAQAKSNLSVIHDDGNFNALLEFRIDAGDKKLEEHLKSAGKNATYISKDTQNELISICGEIVSELIVNDVKDAKFFSVLADETTDSSHQEQLCLCLRYVKNENGTHLLREDFLQFERATDLSGAGLAKQILKSLNHHGLDPKYMVGQGYDGASAMSGHINGVQAHIRKEAPSAIYVHCSSHTLNLVLNSTSSIPEIRSMFSVVQECINFINDSFKRRDIMEKNLKNAEVTITKLKTFCETRFVERHDALLIFQQHYATIVDSLEEMMLFPDRITSDKARAHMNAITDSGFIVALCCAKKVMTLTASLSRALQTVGKDLIDAIESIEFVKKTLQSWRVTNEWKDPEYGPFTVATSLAEKINIELSMPRIAARQRYRSNMPAEDPDQYYRRTIWFPYLDTVLEAMESRFTSLSVLVNKMVAFVPSQVSHFKWNDVKESVQFYSDVLGNPDEEEIKLQYIQWQDFCSKLEKLPATPLETLDIIPSRLSHIKNLLTIFCTVPVTTCSAERAFSTLRVLKNYLRNRMKDERLTGLALMYLHPQITIPVEEVIDRFSNKKTRRLDFVLK